MKPRHVAVGVVILSLAALVYMAAQPLRRSGQMSGCQSNLKQIGLCMMQYVRDYDEHFPRADNWAEGLRPYSVGSRNSIDSKGFQQLFRCPTTEGYYALNVHYAEISARQDKSPRSSPLVFDIEKGRLNHSDDGSSWPASPVHRNRQIAGNNVLFGDGHVELRGNKPRFRAFAPYKPKFGEVLTEEMLRRRREKSKPTPRAKKQVKS